jgi:hypothetical protein|tara:strand:- start:140 stop:418 length:279 start_codon:yes stop_codon:yes gene_type:complete
MARLVEFTETYEVQDLYLRLYGDKYFKHANELKTLNLDPLIADMLSSKPKPYFIQELSDEKFLLICQNLQKALRVDYYFLSKTIMHYSICGK